MKTLKLWLERFFLRTYIVPFETMFATFSIYSGVASIVHFGIISNPIADLLIAFLGPVLSFIFNVGYILSGVGLLFGVGLGRRDFEAFGLIFLTTSIFVRTMIAGLLVGPTAPIANAFFSMIVFTAACMIRLHSILKNRQPVLVQSEVQ